MPSGGLVWVTIQARGDLYTAHDGGAAFDELARQAAEVSSFVGLRKMLSETNFRLTDDGVIWCDGLSQEAVADCASFVGDASLRAAQYLLANSSVPGGARLDSRVKDALRLRYPEGHPDFVLQGLNRQHTFDFGVTLRDEIIVVQAVTPEAGSISAAIVKGLDATKAPNIRVRPVFIYDPADDWGSDRLNMLGLAGARAMDIGRLSSIQRPLTIQ